MGHLVGLLRLFLPGWVGPNHLLHVLGQAFSDGQRSPVDAPGLILGFSGMA